MSTSGRIHSMKTINITNTCRAIIRGVRENTEVVLENGNDRIVLDIDRWMEFYKHISSINDEYYNRFKYQYND